MAGSRTDSVLEGIRPVLTCTVCLQLMKEPKTLPCLHSFCNECILHHIRTKVEANENAACPLCPSRIITEDLVNETKINFNYESMIETLTAKTDEPRHKCSQCDEGADNTDAVSHCTVCGYLCSHCVQGHKRNRTLSQHTIEYFTQQPLTLSTDRKCPTHAKENLTLYCVTHDQVICSTCAFLDHREGCSVNYIDEKTVIAECQSLIVKIDGLERSNEILANNKEHLEEEKKHLKSTYEETKMKIQEQAEVRRKQVEDETAQLTADLDNWYSPLMKQCALQCDDVSQQVNELREVIQSCHTLCTCPPTVDTLVDKIQLATKIEHLEKIEPIDEKQSVRIGLLEGDGLIGRITANQIKEITLKATTTLPTQGEELEVAIETDTGELPRSAAITAFVNGKKAPVIRKDNEKCFIKWIPQKHLVQQVQVDVDDRVKGTLAVSVKRSYTPITPLPEELVLTTPPLGVCLISDDTLAITSSAKTIKLVDSSTFTDKGEINGGFVRPYFMATSKDHMWVTDREAHNIKRISLNDYNVDVVYGNKGAGNCQLAHPRGIAVASTDDRIFIADMRNNRIVVLRIDNDNTATPVTTIGSDRLNQPSGIAFNTKGELAVCDDRNCKVVLFSANGKHLQDMGVGKSGHGLLCSPIGITVDSYGRYIVGEFGSHCITAISPEGTILSSTRTVGGVVQEFTYPRGVTIDNNGFIYVADHGNKRIVRL